MSVKTKSAFTDLELDTTEHHLRRGEYLDPLATALRLVRDLRRARSILREVQFRPLGDCDEPYCASCGNPMSDRCTPTCELRSFLGEST